MEIIKTKRTGERIADFVVKLSHDETTKYNLCEEEIFSVDTCLKDGYDGVIFFGETRRNWKLADSEKTKVVYQVKTGIEKGKWFIRFRVKAAYHKGQPVELPKKVFTYYRERRNGLRTCLKSFLKELIKGGYFFLQLSA